MKTWDSHWKISRAMDEKRRQQALRAEGRPQRTNKYAGACHHCGVKVPAGEGRLLLLVDPEETRTVVRRWFVLCAEGKH